MDERTITIDGQMWSCRPIDALSGDWAFPVGNDVYPPERWYVATWHDPTGVRNGGYKHTGIDINLDVSPWGDIERTLGLSVWALAPGTVYSVVQDWYGVPMTVIEHTHEGQPLYVRYAHIVPVLKVGEAVAAGERLGTFANWRTGDHLHLDMTRTPYTTAWFTTGMMDPLPVLKAHLDPTRVEAMCARGG
jgi:murein DD-endopeptidase MepM/ murein hydrolase activator NlpD